MLGDFLEHTWKSKTPDAACEMLSRADIYVTNEKDKGEQIEKIKEIFGTRHRSKTRTSVNLS